MCVISTHIKPSIFKNIFLKIKKICKRVWFMCVISTHIKPSIFKNIFLKTEKYVNIFLIFKKKIKNN